MKLAVLAEIERGIFNQLLFVSIQAISVTTTIATTVITTATTLTKET
jgi:hypothetical protein